jgi:hypothetical protein
MAERLLYRPTEAADLMAVSRARCLRAHLAGCHSLDPHRWIDSGAGRCAESMGGAATRATDDEVTATIKSFICSAIALLPTCSWSARWAARIVTAIWWGFRRG